MKGHGDGVRVGVKGHGDGVRVGVKGHGDGVRVGVNLDGELIGLKAPLARPRLDNLRLEIEQRSSQLVTRARPVVHRGGAEGERVTPFGIRLLQQQHPLHVVVLDDGTAALLALARIDEALEVASLTCGERRGRRSEHLHAAGQALEVASLTQAGRP